MNHIGTSITTVGGKTYTSNLRIGDRVWYIPSMDEYEKLGTIIERDADGFVVDLDHERVPVRVPDDRHLVPGDYPFIEFSSQRDCDAWIKAGRPSVWPS